jgi:hypothetical protein
MADLTAAARRDIEHACTRLVTRFMTFFDAQEYAAIGPLFAPGGVLVRASEPDAPLVGREAIVRALEARPPQRLTRHLCTNIDIEVDEADHATGSCYLLLYAADMSERPSANGYSVAGKRAVGEYHDEFVRTAEGWRFARRVGRILMHT